jgi:hypothetical protein
MMRQVPDDVRFTAVAGRPPRSTRSRLASTRSRCGSARGGWGKPNSGAAYWRRFIATQTDELAKSLASAAASNGRPLLKAYDELNDRHSNGSYGQSTQASVAINRDDGLSVGSPSAVPRLEPAFRTAAPRAGLYELYGDLACVYWPKRPSPPQQPVSARGAPPILVIGMTGDPVTPYGDAVQVAHQLTSGVLLTNNSNGHTADAGLSGPCDPMVVSYLTRLVVPRNGATCPHSS